MATPQELGLTELGDGLYRTPEGGTVYRNWDGSAFIDADGRPYTPVNPADYPWMAQLNAMGTPARRSNDDWLYYFPNGELAYRTAGPNGKDYYIPESWAKQIQAEAGSATIAPSKLFPGLMGGVVLSPYEQDHGKDGFNLGRFAEGLIPAAALSAVLGPAALELAGTIGGAGAGALKGAVSSGAMGGNPITGALSGGLDGGGAFDGVKEAVGGAFKAITPDSLASNFSITDAPLRWDGAGSGGMDDYDWFGGDFSLDNGGAFSGSGLRFGDASLSGLGGNLNMNGGGSGYGLSLNPETGFSVGALTEAGNAMGSGLQFAGDFIPDGKVLDIASSVLGPETVSEVVKSLGGKAVGTLKGLLSGDAASIKALANIGIPAALLAGLFEKNKGPLDDALTQAGESAVRHAGAFAEMPGLQQTEGQRMAIERAKKNVGNYQPYIDKAGAFTDQYGKGVAGVDLSKYMNPYIDDVLKNSIRDIEESAAKRNQELRAITSRSGNDFRSSVDGGNRFNVEDSLLDRERLRAVGDTSAKVMAGAFDTAWTNAGRDVDRMGTAGQTYGTLGKTVGALGDLDVANLTSAGALEQQPQRDALSKAASNVDVYRSIIPGTSQAATATKDPSMLTNVVGALGSYGMMNKLGAFG